MSSNGYSFNSIVTPINRYLEKKLQCLNALVLVVITNNGRSFQFALTNQLGADDMAGYRAKLLSDEKVIDTPTELTPNDMNPSTLSDFLGGNSDACYVEWLLYAALLKFQVTELSGYNQFVAWFSPMVAQILQNSRESENLSKQK